MTENPGIYQLLSSVELPLIIILEQSLWKFSVEILESLCKKVMMIWKSSIKEETNIKVILMF